MGDNLQKSPMLDHAVDSPDPNYVYELSTILIAVIQEAKDRVSQVQHIFCRQLFSHFQLVSQSWQKKIAEERKAAEEAYKKKENDLMFQMEKLRSENRQVLEETKLLKLDNLNFLNMENQSSDRFKELQSELKHKKFEVNEAREEYRQCQMLLKDKECIIQSYEIKIKELKESDTMLLKKHRTLELQTEELRLELMRKSKEVDELVELQKKNFQMTQAKEALIGRKEMQLKQFEEKSNGHSIKLEDLEKKVNDLLLAVRKKTEEVDKGKHLQENLLKKIEYQALEIMKNEQLLSRYEKDTGLLAAKVQSLSTHEVELQKELHNKINELELSTKAKKQLLQQRDALDLERITRRQQFEESEREKKMILDKKKDLEEKVDKLQECLCVRTKESSQEMELHGKLLQQIEAKNSEVMSEKRKRKDVFSAYKRLKSQYNFLLKKHLLTPGNMLPENEEKDTSEVVRHDHIALTSFGIEDNTSKAFGMSDEVTDLEGGRDILEDNNGVVNFQKSSPVSPWESGNLVGPKCPTIVKSCPPVAAKHVVSHWRDTRSHQNHLGPDPHDDFLNTPLEKVLGNMGKVVEEKNEEPDRPHTVNTNFVDSNDETQDMNVDTGLQKQQMAPPNRNAGTSVFKYVEPVRKKSERENLKGVECKQCKKFYDAVLPEAGKDSDTNKQNLRCEHHDGVSRHRYRYAPPSTPDGFWNIGFDSET